MPFVDQRFQVRTQAHHRQLVPGKVCPGETPVGRRAMDLAPFHKLTPNRLHFGVAIRLLVGQDVPYYHQQFAGDGDNRFLFARPGRQALETRFSCAGDVRPQSRPLRPARHADPFFLAW
jgi:hypothetical protein